MTLALAHHTPTPRTACPQGRRIFAFVIGGVSYSEMRVAHRLSARLGRDIVLGGTSVETPAKFLSHVLDLSVPDPHLALEVDTPSSGGRFKF